MNNNLPELAKLIRYYSLVSTTAAGSGHPTSSMSAADLMTTLLFSGFFRADLDQPEYFNNDRLIFSKGHASPLFYSLYAVAGKVSEEEMSSLRKMGSKLEGHPTMLFPYTEVPTGSLGQGLSVGVGMALNAKLDKLPYRTFVLLGDSEMAEGSVWEAMSSASYYKLNNLVAILDCNRLGQRGETMYGHHTEVYEAKAKAFGWETVVIDGHNLREIEEAYKLISKSANPPAGDAGKPLMIIARTLKGKGVSFIEDKEGKHGVALKPEELELALKELGEVDKSLVGEVSKPETATTPQPSAGPLLSQEGNGPSSPPKIGGVPNEVGGGGIMFTDYSPDKAVSTRKAYGNILPKILDSHPNAVVLDAEVSNSTFADTVKKTHSERFFEMFIAEQNMVGVASGFSRRGKIPFVSTFAAFFSRAFDQIRMSQYAHANIKFVGSHAGVSIGEDGSSQMALEDLAMFRTVLNGVVLYPSDAISTEKLVAAAAEHKGNVYIRTTRKDTAILYDQNEKFPIGGSKTLKSSADDKVTVIGAGVTLHEALAAYEELKKEGVNIRVIDLYSIKPIDVETLKKAAAETKAIITVEDHFHEGGLGEAVNSALAIFNLKSSILNLAVLKEPHSATPDQLLAYEEINKDAIIKKVHQLIAD
jgi:transketolase